jgi:DNA-binding transcriptional ArsR family regulator/uncharacterized protein YndB with AHSA1/START domain
MDDVFRALADPSRRLLLDSLNARNGQTLRQLCAGLDMARQSVSKHLAVLEEAGLVTAVRQGREKLHYLNAAPISDIAERWISRYDQPRVDALADLKRALEETEVEAPSFVYTTYIRTTPERLWQGLTDPAFTRQYWQTELHTDWVKGSQVTWDNHGVLVDDPGSVVLEADPYRRLSYSWHTMSPELAAAFGWDQEFQAKLAAEPRSKVTFDLEPAAQGVKLTVTHDGFEPDSTVLQMVSVGWPDVISSLKTLLETGAALPS